MAAPKTFYAVGQKFTLKSNKYDSNDDLDSLPKATWTVEDESAGSASHFQYCSSQLLQFGYIKTSAME